MSLYDNRIRKNAEEVKDKIDPAEKEMLQMKFDDAKAKYGGEEKYADDVPEKEDSEEDMDQFLSGLGFDENEI